MKIRVKIPSGLCGWGRTSVIINEKRQEFVDDVLLWGMEVEMDVAFYSYYIPMALAVYGKPREEWAVFTVEPDSAFMFCLKWGALIHKGKKKQHNVE